MNFIRLSVKLNAKIDDIHEQIEYLNNFESESLETLVVGSRAETRTELLTIQHRRIEILERLKTLSESQILEYGRTVLLEYAKHPTESKRLELELIGYAVSDNSEHLLSLFMKLEVM